MQNLHINTSELHAHVLPIFWPILWLNIYILRRWYAQHGEGLGAIAIATSNFGVIQITTTYPRAEEKLAHLRLFEVTTEDWCMDQLSLTSLMFARVNRTKLHEICGQLAAFTTREPLTQPPLEPG